MSMQMIKGIQVHGNSKKKLTPRDRAAAAKHEKWLKKMGVGKPYRNPLLQTYPSQLL